MKEVTAGEFMPLSLRPKVLPERRARRGLDDRDQWPISHQGAP
jgi:hypothetical protein